MCAPQKGSDTPWWSWKENGRSLMLMGVRKDMPANGYSGFF